MHTIRCSKCLGTGMTVKIDGDLVTIYCPNCKCIIRQWTVEREETAWKIDRLIKTCREVDIEPVVKVDESDDFEGIVVEITHDGRNEN